MRGGEAAVLATVWRARTDEAADLGALARLLSEPERARVARYRQDADRRRAVLARSMLRLALGAALGAPPQALAFTADARGKPHLTTPHAPHLAFNVSHAGAHVAVALVADARLGGDGLGVDVEAPRPVREDIGLRVFTAAERARLAAAPPDPDEDGRDRRFFALWTCKEAVVKALGAGLAFGLERIDVDAFAPEAPRLTALAGEDPARWRMARFALGGPGPALGAVAARTGGAPLALRHRRLAELRA